MSSSIVIYRKARRFPIYYCIDQLNNKIESLKDWPDQPKEFDLYPYHEEFAHNITDLYEPISEAVYNTIRAYIELSQQSPRSMKDHQVQPSATAY